MRLRLYPEADREIDRAAKHYAKATVTLAHAFLDAVWDGFASIKAHPSRYPEVLGAPPGTAIRRYLLRKFPYLIIYEVRGEVVEIISVSHGARRPGFWKRRRSRRGGR